MYVQMEIHVDASHAAKDVQEMVRYMGVVLGRWR